MSGRGRRILSEVGRFLAVGGVATLVALVIFNALVHGVFGLADGLLAQRPVSAYILANTVGMLISYRGSRTYVFRDRPTTHADGGRTAYFAINLATMAIPVLCLWLSRHLLGHDDPFSDNLSANVIGALLGVLARFFAFRTFVFKRPIHLVEIYATDEMGPVTLGEPTTARSTNAPAATPAPEAAAG